MIILSDKLSEIGVERESFANTSLPHALELCQECLQTAQV